MKSLIILLTLIITSVSFAGGSGGGGVVMTPFAFHANQIIGEKNDVSHKLTALVPSIVFHLSSENGVMRYAHGHLFRGQWFIETKELLEDELVKSDQIFSALSRSELLKEWSAVQQERVVNGYQKHTDTHNQNCFAY